MFLSKKTSLSVIMENCRVSKNGRDKMTLKFQVRNQFYLRKDYFIQERESGTKRGLIQL